MDVQANGRSDLRLVAAFGSMHFFGVMKDSCTLAKTTHFKASSRSLETIFVSDRRVWSARSVKGYAVRQLIRPDTLFLCSKDILGRQIMNGKITSISHFPDESLDLPFLYHRPSDA